MENCSNISNKPGYKDSSFYSKLVSNKTFNIIDENIKFFITFFNVNGAPVFWVSIMKDNVLKTNKTFYKHDWQNNSEKKTIMVEGEYMLSFLLRRADNINYLTMHITKEGRCLLFETLDTKMQ